MRKRNNQGEGKTMLCRHFPSTTNTNTNTTTNHKQSGSTLVSSQSSKHPHEPWSIPIGRNVNDRSWGKRTKIKMAGTQNPTPTRTPGNGYCQSQPWIAADFSILQMVGEGHFGSVYQAKFTSNGAVCARSSTTSSMEHGQHAEQDVRDDMDDINNGSIREDDDTRGGGTGYVALKRFCKSRIQQSQQRGNRALELLRREVNIHSQ